MINRDLSATALRTSPASTDAPSSSVWFPRPVLGHWTSRVRTFGTLTSNNSFEAMTQSDQPACISSSTVSDSSSERPTLSLAHIRRYSWLDVRSSPWVPCAIMRPSCSTRMRSASRIVDRRWAITMVVQAAFQPAQRREHGFFRKRVERGGRLVKNQNRCVLEESPRDAEPLAFPA